MSYIDKIAIQNLREMKRFANIVRGQEYALRMALQAIPPNISNLTGQLNTINLTFQNDLIGIMRLAEEVANPLRKFKEIFEQQVRPFQSQLELIRNFADSSGLARIKEIQGQLVNNNSLKSLRESFNHLDNAIKDINLPEFTPRILGNIQDLIENQENPPSESDFEEIYEEIATHFDKLPKSRVSYEGSIGILFSIFLFLVSFYFSQQSTQTLSDQQDQYFQTIQKGMKELLDKTDKMKPDVGKEIAKTFYIVLRPVHLRIKPTTKSISIAILYPNQLVELHQRKGKWIYVEYFDQISGVPKTGWTFKKYFKRQHP